MTTPRRLLLSFSGGKSSAYLVHRFLNEFAADWDEIEILFANSGQEHPQTLAYVDACSRTYGWPVVWVEAVVAPRKGDGTRHRIVTFDTASRSGEPFAEVIAKYGIPNTGYPHCTRELKLAPITSYLRSLGWDAGKYQSAVGIRADEADRMSEKAKREGVIYPLVKWGDDKARRARVGAIAAGPPRAARASGELRLVLEEVVSQARDRCTRNPRGICVP